MSSSGGTPVSGEHVPRTLMYVNNIHSFILLSSIVLSFIQLIYISISIFFKFLVMQEKLLPTQRIKAIQEELAGFLLREVLHEKGEHYVEDDEHYI
jgi:hypothetical protein